MRSTTFLLTIFVFATSLAISLATDFPCHFSFGVGTSAYQSEGATDVDGRGPSIWDVFPPAADGSTADNATNFYHLYPEDIQNMKEMGVDRFRFSISWSRILPQGTRDKGVNQAGINHYNNLINSLINAGIEPVVTLYHWDLPQALQERFGGWLDKDKISMAFVDYADICFRKFGDRVKTWLTLNEPWATALVAYSYGLYAPGVSGDNFYKVSHNQLVAHAKVAAWYRSHYRHQQGKTSIVLNSDFYEPLDVNNPEDVAATERYQLLTLGLFADPLYFGDYPQLLKSMVGDRLPRFTPLEKRLIRNSVDFLGFNHYTSRIVANINATETQCSPGPFQTNADVQVRYCNGRNGVRIGPSSDTSYFNVYPPGIKGIVKWIAHRYNNPEIRIYENGVDAPNEAELPKEEALVDTFRVNYLRDYLSQLAEAVTVDAVNVTQYSVWSLNDSWEWIAGFQSKFGLHHVDFSDPSLPRTVKSSGTWYREFIRSHKNRCDT